jgi:transcriptional regulator with XRE-family HTH domain
VTNEGFSDLVKRKRRQLSLTQRALADKLGIKPSHVAYLESGHRRPSLSLIKRLADSLGLDPQTLFLLSHPEAEYLLKSRNNRFSKSSREVWRNFESDTKLLSRERVTPDELSILKRVSMLNRVSSVHHFLFILNTIRLFGDENR